MLIRFERTGGFAGMRMATTVDTTSLPAGEAQALHDLVAAAGFYDLPRQIAGAGADRFQYVLAVEEGERQHTVAVDETAIPESLRPLVDRLTAIARSTRRR
jgi:hypothetical protein